MAFDWDGFLGFGAEVNIVIAAVPNEAIPILFQSFNDFSSIHL